MSQRDPVPIELLTKAEAAGLLRVSLKTLNRWAAAGILHPIKLGKSVRYRADDIRALLESRKSA